MPSSSNAELSKTAGTLLRSGDQSEVISSIVSPEPYIRKSCGLTGVAEELLWLISGSTNANVLRNKKINFWNANSSKPFLASIGLESRCSAVAQAWIYAYDANPLEVARISP